jgi:hypothetical protein
MAKWMIVAKNEYRIKTSGIRRIRPYFHYIAILIVGLVVGVFAPAMANAVVNALDIEGFFISVQALALMQVVLFLFFFYFILFPISNTLKDIETQEYEMFISAPIKPGDVLLGKFVGVLPLYAIGIAIITGFFTAFLLPLGIDFIQISIIVAIFVLTLLSAVWIGTVIAALLRTRLEKSARGRDIGKALPLILALPFIAIMYAIMGGGLQAALANSATSEIVETIMRILPSSWGAEMFVLFALNPGDIVAVWVETLTRFGGLILFFIASLWLGAKVANRAYSLEATTFSSATAKPDGRFYRAVKSVGGGGSFGTLLASITKDYARRFENISKLAYMMGLLILINLFMIGSDDPEGSVVMMIFLLPFLSAFVVGEVTIRGKENLFIYRKAPYGEKRLIRGRLLQGLIIILPIVAIYQILALARFTQVPLLHSLAFIGFVLLLAGAFVSMSLGLFLMMPVFSDKPAELMGNVMILMVISFAVFISSLILSPSFQVAGVVMVVVSWMLGISFLSSGRKKLGKIE